MRHGLAYVIYARLLCASMILILGGSANAQQSDPEGVKATIVAFHAALGTLDSAKVEEFWAHESYVLTINPRDKAVSIGWDAVRNSYVATFGFWSELEVIQKDGLQIRVSGAVAWTTGITSAAGKTKTGDAIMGVLNFETCVLEKRDGRWLLVSRSVWRVPQ